MSFSLNKLQRRYIPITASPYRRSEFYIEIPPCEVLRPYVRCFWGTPGYSVRCGQEFEERVRVIPDTCADIIITVDFTKDRVYDNFCGISNKSFISLENGGTGECFTFAIRFYAWSAVIFSDNDMRDSLNCLTESGTYFNAIRRELCEKLLCCRSIYERAGAAEEYLLRILQIQARTENADVMNSLYYTMEREGRVNVDQLAAYSAVSRRTLERLFASNIGASPKQMINMIRYQMLWREALGASFNVHDAVYKFGYFDQAHLLNDFKKYHGISLSRAQSLAFGRN